MLDFTKNLDVSKAIKRYKNLKAQEDGIKKELDTLKAEIVTAMGTEESATCKVGGVVLTVTNKAITSTRVDTKALKAKYPDIAVECSSTTTAPRFTVK